MLHEALLWKELKSGKLNGLDFDRQKIIGNYIVDFYCAQSDVVVEVDGTSHRGREDYDLKRDSFLSGLGLTVIRISVKDVLKDLAGVVGFFKAPPRPCGHPSRGGELHKFCRSAGNS